MEQTLHEEPAKEFTGVVRVTTDAASGISATYLYADSDVGNDRPFRYDLPAFMKKYDKMPVAILGREYTKKVGRKTFYKIIVIAVRTFTAESTN